MDDVAQSSVRWRIEHALRGTSESARRVADLELPALLGFFVTPQRVAKLRAAAVLIAIIDDENGPSVLLTRRATNLRAHSGQVSLPGGAREANDATLATTALREAQEEVNLPAERVEILGYLDDYPTSSNFRVTPVVGWVQGAFTARSQTSEVAGVFRVPLDVVLDSAHYERSSFLRDGIKWPFFQLQHEGHRVWGATAGMLHDLCLKVSARG